MIERGNENMYEVILAPKSKGAILLRLHRCTMLPGGHLNVVSSTLEILIFFKNKTKNIFSP